MKNSRDSALPGDEGTPSATNSCKTIGKSQRPRDELVVMCCCQAKAIRHKPGFIGIGPPTARPRDVVTFLFGFRLPFIIRDHGEYQTFAGGARAARVINRAYSVL